jgi:endo-1,4-beta-xylanase
MSQNYFRSVALSSMIIIASCALFSVFGAVSSGTYDYSHRKRDCKIVVKDGGAGVVGADVTVTQIRNHFGFGGSIRRWAFDTLQAGVNGVTQNYGEAFLKYFDYATPENEMKWAYIQGDSVKAPANWLKADSIVSFCEINDIKIRGHNLFWNEKKDWIPKWSWTLSGAAFKDAMKERIDDAMSRYNGKLAQWDIINEIIHGANNGSTPAKTMLDSMTGDPNIFSWVLDEARKIDKTALFAINDYNLVPGNQSQLFIDKCKPLSAKFDIIGDEGHFNSGTISKSALDTKINQLATGLSKKIWFTEVDWSADIAQSPTRVEELMRTSFANKNVDGLIVWVWCKRKMWADMTSYFVDSLLQETPTGVKWRQIREEFKTKANGKTDAGGAFSFNGYQGKYKVTVGGNNVGTIYLEPGTGTKTVEVGSTSVKNTTLNPSILSETKFLCRGRTISLKISALESEHLHLSSFSINGKLLSKTALRLTDGTVSIASLAPGCGIFRIGSGSAILYTGKSMTIR